MRIVPGVSGKGGVVIVGHFLAVVEIVGVVAVVVVVCVTPIEWWTFRRKGGAGDPKGMIHRMSGIGGFRRPRSGHRRLGEEGKIGRNEKREPAGLLEALAFSLSSTTSPFISASDSDRCRPRRPWTSSPSAQKSKLGNGTSRLIMDEIRLSRISRTGQMLVRCLLDN